MYWISSFHAGIPVLQEPRDRLGLELELPGRQDRQDRQALRGLPEPQGQLGLQDRRALMEIPDRLGQSERLVRRVHQGHPALPDLPGPREPRDIQE